MAAAVVAHRAANLRRNGVQVGDQLLDRLGFQFRLAGDGFVHIVDISGVVFVMVDFHGERIQVRLKRFFGIRQWG